ncbi:RuBisCO-cytochrome methylase RMS1 [Penicillium expansum]|nr:RuBisCO-cytochrome methylase RMS1 [Penicillium expansum]
MSSTIHFPDAEGFQQQSDNFMSWLQASPGVQLNPKLRLADLRATGAGRGVVAQSNIPEGEELFSIPRAMVLTVQNSELRTLLGENLEEQMGPWLSLMLVMVYEYLQGEKSRWAPYFRVLPSRFDTLMFWSPAELQELQASTIVEKIGRSNAEESIRESIAPILAKRPDLFPPPPGLASWEGDAGDAALIQVGHIMGSLIMAYAFDIEKAEDDDDEGEANDESYMTDDEEEEQLPKGMVPLADLLNADADRNNARLYQEEDLLRRYGYVTDNYAVYDVLELSLETICEAAGLANADPESQPRLEFLSSLDILEDGYVIPRPVNANPSLEDIMPAELVEFKQRVSKDKAPRPVLDANATAILIRALQKRQAQYATSLASDLQFRASLSPLPKTGHVRIGEKEVLQTVLAMLQPATSGSLKRSANGDGGDSRQFKTQRV